MRAQRGVAELGLIVVVAAVSLLVGTMAPSINPFNRIFGSKSASAANQKATWSRQTETREPVLMHKGEYAAVGTKETLVYDTGTDERPEKQTLGERIGSFFANLTTSALIFIVVSLAFFGGAPIVWAFRKYSEMRQAFKNTVAALREIPPDTWEKDVKPVLAAKQDRRDKKLVDKMKMELH